MYILGEENLKEIDVTTERLQLRPAKAAFTV